MRRLRQLTRPAPRRNRSDSELSPVVLEGPRSSRHTSMDLAVPSFPFSSRLPSTRAIETRARRHPSGIEASLAPCRRSTRTPNNGRRRRRVRPATGEGAPPRVVRLSSAPSPTSSTAWTVQDRNAADDRQGSTELTTNGSKGWSSPVRAALGLGLFPLPLAVLTLGASSSSFVCCSSSRSRRLAVVAAPAGQAICLASCKASILQVRSKLQDQRGLPQTQIQCSGNPAKEAEGWHWVGRLPSQR